MRRSARLISAAMAAVLAVPALALAGGEEGGAAPARAAFERLKGLEGTWTVSADGQPEGEGAEAMKIVYRVVASGSVVQETMFPGTPHEMVTMYHLDGDALRLTHYCAAGNQPRLRLDPAASTAERLEFAFEGGTNLDPAKDAHMHSGRITFKGADRVEAEWDGYAGGKKQGTHTFVLRRP